MAQQFGPYVLERKIAEGGMAEIHLARKPAADGDDRLVAVKVVHPTFSSDDEFIEGLVEEARLSVQLTHRNIASIFDLGRVDETYYLTMEFVDGRDLFQFLVRASETGTKVPISIAAYVARELCLGLDYAHARNGEDGRPLKIVHRDVSPQNVLLSWKGEVKLCDFGIARARTRASRTRSGVIKGKFSYMSPEQAWGKPLDRRSDIYSAGICLWEMLVGEMLYGEDDPMTLLEMVRRAVAPLPSTLRDDVPHELEQIVMQALTRDPDDRWQTARDMALALDAFVNDFDPEMTSADLGHFMGRLFPEATREEEQDPTLHNVLTEAGPLEPLPPAVDDKPTAFFARPPTRKVAAMGRDDFAPDPEHSVIYEAGHFSNAAGSGASMADKPDATRMLSLDEMGRGPDKPAVDPDATLPPGAVSAGQVGAALKELEQKKAAAPPPGATMMIGRDEVAAALGQVGNDTLKEPVPNLDATRALSRDDPEIAAAIAAAQAAAQKPRPADPPKPVKKAGVRVVKVKKAQAVKTAKPQPPPTIAQPKPPPAVKKPPRVEEEQPPTQALPALDDGQPKKQSAKERIAAAKKRKARLKAESEAGDDAPAKKGSKGGAKKGGAKKGRKAGAKKGASKKGRKGAAKKGGAKKGKKAAKGKADAGSSKLGMVAGSGRKKEGLFSFPVILTFLGILLFGGQSVHYAAGMLSTAMATLKITSEPSKATVYLNGDKKGKTPLTLENVNAEIKHTIKVRKKGYETEEEEEIRINAGEENTRNYFLIPEPGQLKITTDPKGAIVTVNDEEVGESPVTAKDLDRDDPVQISVKKKGYKAETVVFRWKKKQKDKVHVRLNKKKRRR